MPTEAELGVFPARSAFCTIGVVHNAAPAREMRSRKRECGSCRLMIKHARLQTSKTHSNTPPDPSVFTGECIEKQTLQPQHISTGWEDCKTVFESQDGCIPQGDRKPWPNKTSLSLYTNPRLQPLCSNIFQTQSWCRLTSNIVATGIEALLLVSSWYNE